MKGEDFLARLTATHPGYKINVRCLGIMEQLREAAPEVFGQGGHQFFNEEAWKLWEAAERGLSGDHLIAAVQEDKSLPPAEMSFAISLAYAISATHVWNAGDKEHAADLAFDAARWFGFLAGIQGSASAAEKLQRFQGAHRPVLAKTEFYRSVLDKMPASSARNRAAADYIFDHAPSADDGVAPFYWKDKGTMFDREAQREINVAQMTAQIAKAKQRAPKPAEKTQG